MSDEKVTPQRLLEFASMLTANIPTDMSEYIANEWLEDPEGVRLFMAGLRNGPIPTDQIKERVLEVTIFPRRTSAEWVEVGAYEYIDSRYIPYLAHLTIPVSGGPGYPPRDPYKVQVKIFNVGRTLSQKQLVDITTRLGLKQAVEFEYLGAVGEQYPNLQLELGSLVNPFAFYVGADTDHVVPCLYRNHAGKRSLGRAQFPVYQRVWSKDQWFLAPVIA